MRIPRDLNGVQLAKSLGRLGYEVTRQKGSHIRITSQVGGEHHEVSRLTSRSATEPLRLFSKASPRIIR
jgi:hypothetical protein